MLTISVDGPSVIRWRRNIWWWSTGQAERRVTTQAAVLNVVRAASTDSRCANIQFNVAQPSV